MRAGWDDGCAVGGGNQVFRHQTALTMSSVDSAVTGTAPETGWWSTFGEQYDHPASDRHASRPSSDVEHSREQSLLEAQMALNSRTLASLRAKSQLLEVSESSVAQLRSDLAELTATAYLRCHSPDRNPMDVATHRIRCGRARR